MLERHTDILVIGAGHAGCEAALAAARLGAAVTLVTGNLNEVAQAPCNPAMGGPGKAQLVREVDALGGQIARTTDAAMLNVRTLNTGKGAAMHALRAVIDRDRYKREMKKVLEAEPNLSLVAGLIERLTWEDGRITGAATRSGVHFRAAAVIVTTGTFLRGKCHIGPDSFEAGRAGEPPAVGLSDSLRQAGLKLGRLNTGTTPRINRRSLDPEGLEVQPTAEAPLAFSFVSEPRVLPGDDPVYLTRTHAETHRILREAFDLNPGKNGTLGGLGPRYCPSIETKILRFPERSSHQIFLEPEGVDSDEMYLGGLATSSPPEIQEAAVRTIPGLERAKIERYGYDVEYDFAYPTQLNASLETKVLGGLYLAGQINGTTGYEEAAAQGVMAGINAALALHGRDPLVLGRSQAFIGVLIDDLVTKGTEEPYRMLPSRAEHRLLLRQSNADLRLTELGRELGLVDDARYERFRARKAAIESELNRLQNTKVTFNGNRARFESMGLHGGHTLYQALKRPEFDYVSLAALDPGRNGVPADAIEEVEIAAKYEGYIRRQREQVERLRRLEDKRLPRDLPYDDFSSISSEGREKLKAVRPASLGQAARIPGVTQADLAALMIYLKANRKPKTV